MIERAIAGIAVAGVVARAAERARALSRSGAIAAAAVGAVAIAAAWEWGALLLVFFASSSLLSRWAASSKADRTGAIVAKSGPRDAWQVVANGGVVGLAALGTLAWSDARWGVAAAGALAAATADTWSTELGTGLGGDPRSILSFATVPAGTSGGVSLWGGAGAVAGGLLIAMAAVSLGWPAARFAAIATAGVAGSLVDSLLGAAVQARRRCPRCGTLTERALHDCGTPTVHAGGLAWMTNDTVNLVATLAGAAIAVILS